MLCSYCKLSRLANEAPCPNCGALSPLQETFSPSTWEQSIGGEIGRDKPRSNTTPHFQAQDANYASQAPQLKFPDNAYNVHAQPWVTQSPLQAYHPLSAQVQPMEAPRTDQRQALLPVPYQQMPTAAGQTTMSLQLIPDQAIEHLLPALPNSVQADVVHLPPIYTEPRPITPKYQAISSLVSLIIVAMLLCGGSVYYANATGKLAFLQQIVSNARPANLQANQTTLPDPPNKVDIGPAYTTIPSAATALRIDTKTNFVITPINIFSPGQQFYLAFSVISPVSDGRVYTKWYTNNQYFTTVQSKDLIKAHSNESGSVSITYPQAAEGSVEIYWNNQLAQRLYFVVR